eukprot:scaffold1772_cov34-Cyclotella_meneghiniana.AAC.6
MNASPIAWLSSIVDRKWLIDSHEANNLERIWLGPQGKHSACQSVQEIGLWLHEAGTWPLKQELASIIEAAAADDNMLSSITKVYSSPDPSKVYILVLGNGDEVAESGCTIVPIPVTLDQNVSLLLCHTSNFTPNQHLAKKSTADRSKATTKLSRAKSKAKTKLGTRNTICWMSDFVDGLNPSGCLFGVLSAINSIKPSLARSLSKLLSIQQRSRCNSTQQSSRDWKRFSVQPQYRRTARHVKAICY